MGAMFIDPSGLTQGGPLGASTTGVHTYSGTHPDRQQSANTGLILVLTVSDIFAVICWLHRPTSTDI